MGLFDFLKPRQQVDPETAARDAAIRAQTLANLQRGGLPVPAMERLTEQHARQGTDKHFFTSNLSVNELVLTREMGFEPLGQVMGTSVYHVGYQWNRANWGNSMMWGGGSSYELDVLTEAYRNSRVLAFGRLMQEAALLGATGVLGVQIIRRQHDWGHDLLEFAAFGTAIRERHIPPAVAKDHQLFLSDLSAQDFWALRQAGYRPAGIAAGNCTYYQIPTWRTQSATSGGFLFGNSWTNQELPDYTQALYQARELGMARLDHEARSCAGVGIVGVSMDVQADPIEVEVSENQKRMDMMYHFTAMGTVIAAAEAAPTVAIPSFLTVPLNDAISIPPSTTTLRENLT